MYSLLVWCLLRVQHALGVAGVAFFVRCFVVFATCTANDWLAVVIGTALGLFFGLGFVFGGRWADIEERGG
jgi:hypothetical protein